MIYKTSLILFLMIYACSAPDNQSLTVLSEIEHNLGIDNSDQSGLHRLDSINTLLKNRKCWHRQSAFAAYKEDTVSLDENYMADFVLATVPRGKSSYLIYNYNAKKDTVLFNGREVFSVCVKPDKKGENLISGYIYNGETKKKFYFKMPFFVR